MVSKLLSAAIATGITTISLFTVTYSSADQVSADQVSYGASSLSVTKSFDQTPDQNFINKFNKAVVLVNNQFTIDYSKLPSSTNQLEITKLQSIISENNTLLKDNTAKFSTTLDNSVLLTDNVNNSSFRYLSRFKNGSNYVHVYWWGLRIGLSRNTVNNAGKGVTLAGFWIPHRVIAAAVSSLGFVMDICPGGIVFNSTPGISSFWGFEFQ